MSSTVNNEPTRQEFVDLIARYQNQIFGFICAMVRNRDDAQDVYQQTLLVLWKKFESFEAGTNFTAWAFRIAEREIWAFRRRRPPEGSLGQEALSLVAEALREAAEGDLFQRRQDALPNCLAKLPADDRSLIEQVYNRRRRVNDIAQDLGRLPQSITNSLRRIRRALFDCIERAAPREGEVSQ